MLRARVQVYYLQQSFGFDDQEVGYIVVILGFGIIMSQVRPAPRALSRHFTLRLP